jgi:hypothetical protein
VQAAKIAEHPSIEHFVFLGLMLHMHNKEGILARLTHPRDQIGLAPIRVNDFGKQFLVDKGQPGSIDQWEYRRAEQGEEFEKEFVEQLLEDGVVIDHRA